MIHYHSKLTDVWEMLQKTEGNALLSSMNALFKAAANYRDSHMLYKELQPIKEMLNSHLDRVNDEMDKLEIVDKDNLNVFAERLALAIYMLDMDFEQSKEDRKGMANEIYALVKALDMSIEGALKGRVLYYVDPHNAKRIENGEREFGQQVIDNFPEACYDLDEAMKCLGFSLHTACVCHLMRAVEHVLYVVGDELNVTLQRHWNWGTIIKKLDKQVRSMNKGPKKDYWSTAIVQLGHIKDCCRLKSMHVHQYKYTEEEATDVYHAVKAFLKSLAQELAVSS